MSSLILNKDKALKIADFLLQIKAVKLNPSDPFTWSSGMKSPIYCDNRKTLSFPSIRAAIRQTFSEQIKNQFETVDVIAGVATGGIAIGALVAEEMGLPFIYVRSRAKKHGKQNKIEGYFEKGQSVILIEDLISSGKSSLEASIALKEAGANIKGIVSIFTYGFDTTAKNFKNSNSEYISLCDYNTLLIQAIEKRYINKEDLAILKEWKENPSIWKK